MPLFYEVRPDPAEDADSELLWEAAQAAGFVCATLDAAKAFIDADYRTMAENLDIDLSTLPDLEWTELEDGGWRVQPDLENEEGCWSWVVRPVQLIEA